MIATVDKPVEELTLLDYIDKYELLRPLSLPRRNQYRYSVRSLNHFAKYEVTLTELSDELVNRWLLDLRRRGLAPRTIKSYRTDILTLWRSAAVDGLAIEPRRISPVKLPQSNPDAWTQDDLRRLLAAAGELKGYFRATGVKCSDWWTAFLLVGWDTALRFTDMFRFRGSDILPGGELLLIQSKTGQVHRARLRPETLLALEKIASDMNAPALPLWGKYDVFFRRFRKLIKAAGLPGSPKWLRRASATAVEVAYPGSAMAHLGHRTAGLAYKNYVDQRQIQHTKPLPPSLEYIAPEVEATETELPTRFSLTDDVREALTAPWLTRKHLRTVLAHLESLGITQPMAAKVLMMTPGQLAMVTRGRHSIPDHLRRRLRFLFGVTTATRRAKP